MKLEGLALWDERELDFEQAVKEASFGAVCSFRGAFAESGGFNGEFTSAGKEYKAEVREQLLFLTDFLSGEHAGNLLQSVKDMNVFCRERLHDHIPYAFNRECWCFRVLTDEYVWYLSCTPWNEKRHFCIYGFDRSMLMTELAARRGLPESCYGVLRFTGERIRIRFGADSFECFPQYGGRADMNRRFAREQNEPMKITAAQVSAMEGGVVFGWETPVANPQNYDVEGHYIPLTSDGKTEKKKR